MTDRFHLDDEPFVLVVPSGAAIPPGDITEAEWLALKDRVTVLEAGSDLGDLNDVDTAGVTDGQTIIYDADSGTFLPGSSGGTLERIDAGGASSARYDVGWLRLQNGLIVEEHPTVPSVTIVRPNYGTGLNTIAEGRHTHTRPTRYAEPIAPGAYMSSGTRQLGSLNITLPTDRTVLVEAWITMQMRGGDPGPCHYRFNLTIAGNTRTSGTGDNGFWCVQGVPDKTGWEHHQYLNGNGSTITVSASVSYDGAGGFYTDAGTLWARVSFSR